MKITLRLKKISLMLFGAVLLLTACKKEDVLAPGQTTGETILYIKAVKTDSTVVESERVVLR